MKKFLVMLVLLPLVVACEKDADVASKNLSKAADQFEIQRRITFVNGITDTYLLIIEGRCALGNFDSSRRLSVTCKTGPDAYQKHFLGLSDNVTFVAEQLVDIDVSVYHNRLIFKPQSIVPDIDFRGDIDALVNDGTLE